MAKTKIYPGLRATVPRGRDYSGPLSWFHDGQLGKTFQVLGGDDGDTWLIRFDEPVGWDNPARDHHCWWVPAETLRDIIKENHEQT